MNSSSLVQLESFQRRSPAVRPACRSARLHDAVGQAHGTQAGILVALKRHGTYLPRVVYGGAGRKGARVHRNNV
jgi:hypothetical protein